MRPSLLKWVLQLVALVVGCIPLTEDHKTHGISTSLACVVVVNGPDTKLLLHCHPLSDYTVLATLRQLHLATLCQPLF